MQKYSSSWRQVQPNISWSFSWHGLHCANHPFNAYVLDILQLSFKPLFLLSLLACMGVNGPDAFFHVSLLGGLF